MSRRKNEVKEEPPNDYQEDGERVIKYSTPPYLNQIDNKVNNFGYSRGWYKINVFYKFRTHLQLQV